MLKILNPFITIGYESEKYFCDRELETQQLIQEITSGNNVALISTRKMGKTGLIEHFFNQETIKNHYYTFFIDIYATKTLKDFVFALSKEILEKLKPLGKKFLEIFVNSIQSLRAGISYDIQGTPFFNISLNDIRSSETTLQEIFNYLSNADKPCIVAIDEFQQIENYRNENVEALLRTYIQHCNNAKFIFSGSRRHTMSNMFLSASRPFYQSVSMMHLSAIPLEKYIGFAIGHFQENHRNITVAAIENVYQRFEGVTWYIQKMMNTLYNFTEKNETCDVDMLEAAVEQIIQSNSYSYVEILFRLPEKQKDLLVAIAKEHAAEAITSSSFLAKYALTASSVQAALKGLLSKDFITLNNGIHQVYDQFFELWLRKNY